MKACPVPLCGDQRVRNGMLMCAACWRRVPRLIRGKVYSTFRQLGGQHGDRGSSRLTRIRAYQQARDAAIAASAEAR